MAMCGERFKPSRNWGTAKISLEKDEWDHRPIDSSPKLKREGDEKFYRYKCGDFLGKGITIYIIDGGGFLNNDFVSQQRQHDNEGSVNQISTLGQ